MKDFYRRECGARKWLTRKKNKIVSGETTFSYGEELGYLLGRLSHLHRGGVGRVYMTDYHIGTNQKIPDWRVKTTFLGQFETCISLGIKIQFGDGT